MTKKYKEVEVTKENLESLKVSNYVRVNDWQWGLRVVGVSKNFIVLHNNKGEYSVVEKREGKIDHLSIRKKGIFHCGSQKDIWILKIMNGYKNTLICLNLVKQNCLMLLLSQYQECGLNSYE